MLGLSQEQIENILNRYYQGESPTLLESEFNLASGSIKYIRKKLNKPAYKKFSDALLKQIVQEHMNGKLMKDIEMEYNISHYTVYRYMEKNNIEFKNQHGRKNHFNQDYFSCIDHQDKAYWLGFIYADGNVACTGGGNTKTNRLTINISHKDVELLEAFCEDIGLDSSNIVTYEPKGTYSNSLMSRIYLNSIKLCADLEQLGVYPNKTGTLSSFPNIPSEMIPHFLRGFFDGDGWIETNNNVLGFVSDELFIEQIDFYLFNKLNIDPGYIYKENRKDFPVYYLKYYKTESIKAIYSLFYKDANRSLKRKHDIIKSKF